MTIADEGREASSATNVNGTNRNPWIFCHFQKDKLKFSERYNQKLATVFRSSSDICHQSPLILIPDGPFLRKYLGFLEELFEPNSLVNGTSTHTLLLLESAAEYMDLRNSSPCISHGLDKILSFTSSDIVDQDDSTLTKEASNINERSRIMKLWQKCDGDSSSMVNIVPFPDLTYRNKSNISEGGHYEDDDFDLLSYADMSVEDRSRCSLVRAANMYRHLISSEFSRVDKNTDQLDNMRIVLLTEDKVHLDSVDLNYEALDCSGLTHLLQEKIQTEGDLHIDNLVPDDHWVNLQQHCEEEYDRRNKPHKTGVLRATDFGHAEHLKDNEQVLGLKENRFHKGKLKVTDINPKEAYVSVQLVNGKRATYFLNGNNGHFNRALHEDTVVIEPLPESKWEQPVGKIRLLHESDGRNSDKKGKIADGNPSLNSKASLNRTIPTARVVAIHSNSSLRRKFIATLQSSRSVLQRHESSMLVVPMDKRIPKIRIKTNVGYDKLVKKRLLVVIDGWDLESSCPRGHFVKIIGEVGHLETEVCTNKPHFLRHSYFNLSRHAAQSISSEYIYALDFLLTN